MYCPTLTGHFVWLTRDCSLTSCDLTARIPDALWPKLVSESCLGVSSGLPVSSVLAMCATLPERCLACISCVTPALPFTVGISLL